MPYIQLDEYGLIEENSPCFDCENAYVEDIWYEWMCKAKECPYQKEHDSEQQLKTGGEVIGNHKAM